jgi:hypothetical protein
MLSAFLQHPKMFQQFQAVLLHGQSGQSMFEMHIHKVKLTQEALLSLATSEPNLFATW